MKIRYKPVLMGNPHWAAWIRDNYYTFYNNGYGVFHERGVVNPQIEFETDESFDKVLKTYKYIQFTYQGGKTIDIVNRVQKPAFFDTWQIITVSDSEMVFYQQDRAFNQEHVLVFKRYGTGI